MNEETKNNGWEKDTARAVGHIAVLVHMGEIQKSIKALEFLLTQKEKEVKQKLAEEIRKLKKRFRCAACDGAKCGHTHCCQALSLLIKNTLARGKSFSSNNLC